MGKSSNDLFNRYKANFSIREVSEPFLRFLFESRGISTADWELSPTSGEYARDLKINPVDLMTLDNDRRMKVIYKNLEDADLIRVLNDSSPFKAIQNSFTENKRNTQISTRKKICVDLKKMSIAAIAGTSEPTSTSKPGVIVQ